MIARLVLMCTFVVAACSTAQAQNKIDQNRPAADPISKMVLHPWQGDFRDLKSAGFKGEELFIPNAQGKKLRAWFIPGKDAKQTILFCMGNTGNISVMLPYADIFHKANFDVLMFDYQGFGNSEGLAALNSLVTDSLAAFDFLVETKGQKPQDIGVFGVSLGSVISLTIAAEREVGAVAVEDVFLPNEQLDNLSKNMQGNPLAKFAIASARTLLVSRVAPTRNVKRIKAPIFLIHGQNDQLLPPTASIRLAKQIAGPHRTWLMPAIGHAPESLEVNDREYASQLQQFFREAFAGEISSLEVMWKTNRTAKEFETTISTPKSSGRSVPLEIVLASDSGQMQFRRAYSGKNLVTKTKFEPAHVTAVQIHHAIQKDESTWQPELSEFSRMLAEHKQQAALLFKLNREFFMAPPGAQFRRFEFVLQKLPVPNVNDSLKKLPDAQELPPRIQARYARLLARLAEWPKPDPKSGKDDVNSMDRLAAAKKMLAYLPANADDYYELGNARFELMFRDSIVCDALIRVAKAELTQGNTVIAQKHLQQYLSILPEGSRPLVTADRIEKIRTIKDLDASRYSRLRNTELL